MKNNFNQLTGRDNPELIFFEDHLIHPFVLSPLIELKNSAKEEINADLQIVSSYRNFGRQQIIWDGKVKGQRKVLDDNDKIIIKEDLSMEEYLLKILRFSAIPGASRHHWGTDFDVYDASKISKEDLQLTHSECIGKGPCTELHIWLDGKLKRNQYFFRPYNVDLDGVSIEKWHLSFFPIAQEYFQQYDLDLFIQNLNESDIQAKDLILKNPEFYFKKFVQNIVFP